MPYNYLEQIMRPLSELPIGIRIGAAGLGLAGALNLAGCSGAENSSGAGTPSPTASPSEDTGTTLYQTEDYRIIQVNDKTVKIKPTPFEVGDSYDDKKLERGVDIVYEYCPGSSIDGTLTGYQNGPRSTIVYMKLPRTATQSCHFPLPPNR